MTVVVPASNRRLALILLLGFLVYVPSLFNGFTYDDNRYAKSVLSNGASSVMVAELRPFPEYFVQPMGWDGRREMGRGFRPITVYAPPGSYLNAQRSCILEMRRRECRENGRCVDERRS